MLQLYFLTQGYLVSLTVCKGSYKLPPGNLPYPSAHKLLEGVLKMQLLKGHAVYPQNIFLHKFFNYCFSFNQLNH